MEITLTEFGLVLSLLVLQEVGQIRVQLLVIEFLCGLQIHFHDVGVDR